MTAELVCRAQDGNAEAYTDLVRRFQDGVYATAYQAVYDPQAAQAPVLASGLSDSPVYDALCGNALRVYWRGAS
jgi:hypothetical protein